MSNTRRPYSDPVDELREKLLEVASLISAAGRAVEKTRRSDSLAVLRSNVLRLENVETAWIEAIAKSTATVQRGEKYLIIPESAIAKVGEALGF